MKNEEIIIEGNLELIEDYTTEKKLMVKGNIFGKDGIRYNINAWDIDAWDINARNIDARDINARDINAQDINAQDIDAQDIDAQDIDAWDIICETRKKKSKTSKTKCRIYVKNKSEIEIKKHDD